MCYAWLLQAGAQGAQSAGSNPNFSLGNSTTQSAWRRADPLGAAIWKPLGDPLNLYGEKNAPNTGALLSNQLALREGQIDEQASAEMGNETLNAWQQRAHMLVSSGEAGVGGNSVQAQLKASLEKQGQADALIQLNALNQKQGALVDSRNLAAGYATNSTAGTALQIGAQGFNDYEQYQYENGR